MTDSPNTWDIGEAIPIEIFIMNPVTNLGLIDQVAYITFSISRGSDDKYWNGSIWVDSFAPLSVTEPNDTNQKGRYLYTLSAAGNSQEDVYTAQANINNPGVITGNNFEVHRSRTQTPIVVEGEPAQ